jgi:hypothetical protein
MVVLVPGAGLRSAVSFSRRAASALAAAFFAAVTAAAAVFFAGFGTSRRGSSGTVA